VPGRPHLVRLQSPQRRFGQTYAIHSVLFLPELGVVIGTTEFATLPPSTAPVSTAQAPKPAELNVRRADQGAGAI
jgi:hypothetical protein